MPPHIVEYAPLGPYHGSDSSVVKRGTQHSRVISYFISSNKPVGNQSEIGVLNGRVVSHLDGAAVRILPLCKELVDGIQSVGLNSIIGSEDDEHRRIGLQKIYVSNRNRRSCGY